MTKDEFAAIKGREKVATPGPWAWHKGDSCNAYPTVYTGEHEFPVLDIGTEDYPGRAEDAEFVAHARVDIPNLIAEVERLEEKFTMRETLYKVAYKAAYKAAYEATLAKRKKEVHHDQR